MNSKLTICKLLRMTVTCYLLSDGPQLAPCEYSAALEAINSERGLIWIDLQEVTDHELEGKLDDLRVQGLIRRFCLETRDHPGFYPLKPMSLLVIPIYTELKDSRHMEYLSLLYREDFLLSFRNKEMTRFRKDLTLQEYASLLPDSSIEGIISSITLGLSLVSLRKIALLTDGILAMEEKIDLAPNTVEIEEISDIRLELISLESVVHGQLPIIETLVSATHAAIEQEKVRNYFLWASANLNSAHRTLAWLERRVDVMRSMFEANAQEKTNRRLRRLTVLSTIFMPITFLAGVWGMNFEFMPELSSRLGYMMALASMLIIGSGMYFTFRKMGWFD